MNSNAESDALERDFDELLKKSPEFVEAMRQFRAYQKLLVGEQNILLDLLERAQRAAETEAGLKQGDPPSEETPATGDDPGGIRWIHWQKLRRKLRDQRAEHDKD